MGSREQFDYLVVGAGVAGLRAAVELARHGEVLVVTKEAVAESNTHYAQGGIAVAMEGDEDVALHLEDTMGAGDGLVHRPAAAVLVAEGPVRVAEMIEWGANFDRRADGELMRTREGAHSLPRILHANGDATGAEISRSLAAYAAIQKRIHFAEWSTVTRLLVSAGRVHGAELMDREHKTRIVFVKSVVLAAGGAGQVFSDTTNPAVATGDGLALAWQAGAALADMEFYQFHPTALSLPNAPRFLLSEALRGEGAWLRNDKGERFMERYHKLLELAPRDVVARAITREGMGTEPGEQHTVYLDLRHLADKIDLRKRFPGISATLDRYNLALSKDLLPIRPAAHYLMGGVKTDLDGRTSLRGLYAAGEVACTGVHGANRLASNSLLEGLVFGARAAQAVLADGLTCEPIAVEAASGSLLDAAAEGRIEALIVRLQAAMWMYAGLLREAATLAEGIKAVDAIGLELEGFGQAANRRLHEARAMVTVARTILRGSLARTESRGAHFRNDFPKRDDANFQKHSRDVRGAAVLFESWQ